MLECLIEVVPQVFDVFQRSRRPRPIAQTFRNVPSEASARVRRCSLRLASARLSGRRVCGELTADELTAGGPTAGGRAAATGLAATVPVVFGPVSAQSDTSSPHRSGD